jgi:hypothetical protein
MKKLNHKMHKNHKIQKSVLFENFVHFVGNKNYSGIGHG